MQTNRPDSPPRAASDGPVALELDALIIGAGFSGIYLLHKLRDELKLNVKVFESNSDIGGTWYANQYPGARVDCPAPTYALSIDKVWKTWKWKEKYPGQKELSAYLDHIDKTLSIRKDCYFRTEVISAEYDQKNCKWTVKSKDGKIAFSKYLIVSIGFASKSYIPSWKGLDTFQGTIHHSSNWTEKVDVKGKRVAVIGTGSTGVQIAQDWARTAAEMFVFQRTPNLCLPMRQQDLDEAEQEHDAQATMFAERLKTLSGLLFGPYPKRTFDETPEEREKLYEQLYRDGGFLFWQANYQDLLTDLAANREAYDFWAKKTRERIQDPVKKDLLAPLEPPHPFGTKRPSLEQDFYEQLDKPNVHIVSTKETPIVEFTPTGIVTEDGKHYEVDVIAVATGFDAMTGGLNNLGLKDVNGKTLAERWKDGLATYLGLSIEGFPNMFLTYSVQSPTAFSNGPVTIEVQGDSIADIIQKMKDEGVRAIEATPEAVQAWREENNTLTNMTLFPLAKSWYTGANIPGKRIEQMFYLGGMPEYQKRCRAVVDADFVGYSKVYY